MLLWSVIKRFFPTALNPLIRLASKLVDTKDMTLETIHGYLRTFENTWFYSLAIGFYGLYPIVTCLVYVVTALIYNFRRPLTVPPLEDGELPFVSIVVPAYCEENVHRTNDSRRAFGSIIRISNSSW
jgi:hypothetical protein